jgi:beta-glucosidase/6-phospho-beta-glucosidase/beta-galactosidase
MGKGLDTLKALAVKSDGSEVTRRLTLVFAVLALLGIPARASAAPGMEIAIQDDGVLVARHYYDRDKALAQVRDLGATRIRMNLGWAGVLGSQAKRRHMPHRLKYNWRKYDDAVNAALFHGLRVQLTITGPAPRWATGNDRVGVYKVNASRYGAFARSAAQHFGVRVDRYSIWNEPNYKGWLAPMKSAPKIYRGLFRAGWRGIKSVEPGRC